MRLARRIEIRWLRWRARRADRDACRAERIARLSWEGWYATSEGLPVTAEQERALDEGS